MDTSDFESEPSDIQDLIVEDIHRFQDDFYTVSEEQKLKWGWDCYNVPYVAPHMDYHSKSIVKVYGNCCEITQDPLTDYQKFEEAIYKLHRKPKPSDRIVDHVNFKKKFKETGMLFFKRVEDDYANQPPKRIKGDIYELSRKSRRRLTIRLNQPNPDSITKFFHCALTYPKLFPKKGEEHKADLDAFLKRVKRKYGDDIECLWRLEFQKRGAPHYHLMLYLPEDHNVVDVRKWFAQNWFEVSQRFRTEKDEKQINAGTSVDRMFSLRGGRYLAKYMSKDEDTVIPDYQGRLWGCTRNWGDVVLKHVELTRKQVIHFRRLVRRFLKSQKRMQKLVGRPLNLTIFGHWSFFTHAIDWVKDVY